MYFSKVIHVGSELAALLRTRAEVELQRLGTEDSEATTLALTLVAEPVEVHPVQYAVLPGYVACYIFPDRHIEYWSNEWADIFRRNGEG